MNQEANIDDTTNYNVNESFSEYKTSGFWFAKHFLGWSVKCTNISTPQCFMLQKVYFLYQKCYFSTYNKVYNCSKYVHLLLMCTQLECSFKYQHR